MGTMPALTGEKSEGEAKRVAAKMVARVGGSYEGFVADIRLVADASHSG